VIPQRKVTVRCQTVHEWQEHRPFHCSALLSSLPAATVRMPQWKVQSFPQVQTFGSFVNGLGMHSSDLDLVITGILAPDHPQNGGLWVETQWHPEL
jgi:hypothetical protein